TAANRCLSIAEYIVGKSKPRRKVALVHEYGPRRDPRISRELEARRGGWESRGVKTGIEINAGRVVVKFPPGRDDIPPQAQIQCQPRRCLVGIVSIEPQLHCMLVAVI